MATKNQPPKGVIRSITVNSIVDKKAFGDNKAKSNYLRILSEVLKAKERVKLLAYSILDTTANLLLYSSDEKLINEFMVSLNESYASFYNQQNGYNGFIFKLPNQVVSVKPSDVVKAISHIHKLPEYNMLCDSYKNYKYSSCRGIFKGSKLVDKSFLLSLVGISRLDGKTYTQWHKAGLNKKMGKPDTKKEKMSKAIETSKLRYMGTTLKTDENTIKQIIIETNERTFAPYRKIERKLGLKGRRDILIDVVASMVFDNGYTFLDAVDLLQAEEYGVFRLLLEVIVTINKLKFYGYDYIINKLQVEDSNYDLLIEIIKILNRNNGMGFVEISKKFNLQNNIIEIRMRTGL
ncbi:MAG: hypothetical protein ACOCWI_00650 [Bacillota bacterium]